MCIKDSVYFISYDECKVIVSIKLISFFGVWIVEICDVVGIECVVSVVFG